MGNGDRFAEVELFSCLLEEQIKRIVAISREESYDSGVVILEESSRSSDLFILVDGRVSVEIKASSPEIYHVEKKPLAILRQGDVFGEIAFLKGTRRVAAVTALGTVKVLRMDGERLEALLAAETALGYRVMRNLSAILAQRLIDVNFMWRDEV